MEGLVDNWTEGPRASSFGGATGSSSRRSSRRVRIVEKDGVVRWRRLDLKRVIAERFGVDFHPRYVGKLLKKLGFSHISARPRHPAQDERTVEAFKKTSARAEGSCRRPARRRRLEIWFEDEAQIGRKNGQVRRWARRETRPRAARRPTPICSARSAPPAASGDPRAALRRR